MNARRFESTVIAISLLMILFSAYQLFLRPLGESNASSSWQAWLGHLENSAKHRRADDLVWRDLFPGDRLGSGDSVFTGDDARAQLKFREGQELILSSNTLVRIKSDNNLSKLLLEQGVVQATLGAEALEFEMDGKKVQLSGDGAQVQIVKDGAETALSVVEGQAKLTTENEQVTIATNEEVKVGSKIEKKILAYRLISPLEGSNIWSTDSSEIEFKWENPKSENVQITVSSDLRGKNIAWSGDSNAESLSKSLMPGSYYWRVTGKSGESRVGTFSIRREPELTILSPRGDVHLPLTDDVKETRLMLEWTDSQVKQYIVKLNDQELVAQTNQLLVDVLVGEEFKWQVIPQDEKRPMARSSSVVQFKVLPPQLPARPTWLKDGPLQLSRGKANSPDLFFKGDAPRFKFEVREGSAISFEGETQSEAITFPDLPAGRYSVVVRGVNSSGRSGAWSESLIIDWTPFETRPPDAGQKIVLTRPDQKISFEWESKGEQIFELASDEEFKNVLVTKKGQGEAEVIFPKVGTFFWRARNLDGSFSEPKKVLVEPSPPLDAPGAPPTIKKEIEIHFIEPKSSWVDFFISRAYASEYEASVVLELPENDLAVSYHVEIFADEELLKKVYTTRTTKSEFEWKGARPGKYWWRYALVDAWGRETAMGPAAELRLTEGSVKAPGKPKLLRPIRAIELDEAPQVVFAWSASERTDSYLLEVGADDDFEELLASSNETKTQSFVSTEKWPRGETLYWRVTARHKWGQTQSNTGRFIVGKKPILTAQQMAALPWRPMEAYSWVRAGFEPQRVSVELDDREYNGKIDGNVLNSWSLTGRKILTKRWSMNGGIKRQSGKVFKGEDYSRMEIFAHGEWFKRLSESSLIYLGAGVNGISSMTYKLATPSQLKAESVTAISASFNLEHEWRFAQKSSLHTQISTTFGKWTSYGAVLSWRQFIRHDLFWEAGGLFEQATFKAQRGDNKFSSMGAVGRVGISF